MNYHGAELSSIKQQISLSLRNISPFRENKKIDAGNPSQKDDTSQPRNINCLRPLYRDHKILFLKTGRYMFRPSYCVKRNITAGIGFSATATAAIRARSAGTS